MDSLASGMTNAGGTVDLGPQIIRPGGEKRRPFFVAETVRSLELIPISSVGGHLGYKRADKTLTTYSVRSTNQPPVYEGTLPVSDTVFKRTALSAEQYRAKVIS
jgi:hypothetical protein